MADVTVVIGNYEGAHLLPDCLESLSRQTRPPSAVIVVDAGSSDDSVEVARRLGATVIEAANRGLGYLYNLGARASLSSLVLLANPDVAFDQRCTELLAAALEEDPRRFAADPQQLECEGERVIHARTLLHRGRILREPLPGLRIDPAAPADGVVPTLTANAGAMMVRRDMLLALGGFDESFFLEFEDLDLCWRAWLRGWESVYVPAARVRHRVGGSTGPKDRPRRLAASHHSLIRFSLKCLPAGAAARVLAGELLRLPAHPRPVAAGLGQALRELPTIRRLRVEMRPTRGLLDWLLEGQEGPPPTRST